MPPHIYNGEHDMKTVQNKRDQSVNTYIMFSQVFFFLLIGLLILRTSGITFNNYFNTIPIGIVTLCFLLTLTPLLARIRFKNGENERFWDWLIIIFYVAISIFLLIKENDDFFKIVLLMPVMILSLKYGLKTALFAAAFSSAAILVISGFENFVSIDADIVFCGVILLFAWLLGNMTETELLNRRELERLASFDGLTDIYNHRSFHHLLDEEIVTAKQTHAIFSLLMLDIDHFKIYNDALGHQQGDQILHKVAVILSSVVEGQGICARYGGAEFSVIFPGLNIVQTRVISEKIRSALESYNFPNQDVFPKGYLSGSIGIAEYPLHADGKEKLIKKADEALYRAKFISKNKVEGFYTAFETMDMSLKSDEQELFNSISTFTMVINAKDSYTYGHSQRVMELANHLAIRAGLDSDYIRQISFGAILHDIGKVEIPREVLNNTGKLSEAEWDYFRQHPVWGANIVDPLKSLSEVKAIILYHHENYNGTGYPEGISGAAIPLGARLLRIVDSFDAMTSSRCYKVTISIEEALADLALYSGTFYDPELLACFLEMMAEEEMQAAM